MVSLVPLLKNEQSIVFEISEAQAHSLHVRNTEQLGILRAHWFPIKLLLSIFVHSVFGYLSVLQWLKGALLKRHSCVWFSFVSADLKSWPRRGNTKVVMLCWNKGRKQSGCLIAVHLRRYWCFGFPFSKFAELWHKVHPVCSFCSRSPAGILTKEQSWPEPLPCKIPF